MGNCMTTTAWANQWATCGNALMQLAACCEHGGKNCEWRTVHFIIKMMHGFYWCGHLPGFGQD